jgi:hypothetical protein
LAPKKEADPNSLPERELYTGLSAQILWMARELLGSDGVTKVGFKYYADIVWFNSLMKGNAITKCFKFGGWLLGLMCSDLDVEKEEQEMIRRASQLGLKDLSPTICNNNEEHVVVQKLTGLYNKLGDFISSIPAWQNLMPLSMTQAVEAMTVLYKALMIDEYSDDCNQFAPTIITTLTTGMVRDEAEGHLSEGSVKVVEEEVLREPQIYNSAGDDSKEVNKRIASAVGKIAKTILGEEIADSETSDSEEIEEIETIGVKEQK